MTKPYNDLRYRPNITQMGLEKGDIVKGKHVNVKWEILSIGPKGKCLIQETHTDKKVRVTDSFFKSVEKVKQNND